MTPGLWAQDPSRTSVSQRPCSLTLWGPSRPRTRLSPEAPMAAESGERARLQRLRGKKLTPGTCRGRNLPAVVW